MGSKSLFHKKWRRLRLLVAHKRTNLTDGRLALVLAGIAGCANAGGFMVLGQYTSHMTGYLSRLADNTVLQRADVVITCLLAIAFFILGAASSAILINWSRAKDPHQQYAWPIRLQGLLFLVFAVFGAWGESSSHGTALAQSVLCFIMGLQNATITKISNTRIRTTHVTGIVTDIGIELGRFLCLHVLRLAAVKPDVHKLTTLLGLVFTFFAGGVVGAVGYSRWGFPFSLVLSALLFLIAAPKPRRKNASRHT